MKKRIIFIAPPGAGKGTQAKKLSVFIDVPHISTGDIIRYHVANGTDLGKQVEEISAAGGLVPDSIMMELIKLRLSEEDTSKGWILDGFPRTILQAEFLCTLLNHQNQTLDCALELKVPDAVLKERIAKRALEANPPRPDDANPEVIENRLKVYGEETYPLLDFYRERQQLYAIDGNASVDDVTKALKTIVLDKSSAHG